MRRLVLSIAFALVCAGLFAALSARPAHAEPPGLTIATPLTAAPWSSFDSSLATIVPPPVTTTTSYRWQLVVADLSALTATAVLGGMTGDEDRALGFGAGAFLLGSPVIHASNHHGWRAIASLAVRATLPAIGLGLGAHFATRYICENCIDQAPPLKEMMIGLAIGGLTAMALDYGVIARPTKERGFAPSAAPTQGGATVAISARF